jgi:hypothetical protein
MESKYWHTPTLGGEFFRELVKIGFLKIGFYTQEIFEFKE